MRFIALDVHRDFCEVAIAEDGRVRRAGRLETTPARLELFARSLAADDRVALEATGNAVAIARIIEPVGCTYSIFLQIDRIRYVTEILHPTAKIGARSEEI